MSAGWATAAAITAAALSLVNVAVSYGLTRRSARHEEIKEIRLALLEVRDLVWDGSRAVENHLAKLRIRLHSLGFEREALDLVKEAAGRCRVETVSADEMGIVDIGVDPDTPVRTIDSSRLNELDRSLETMDQRLSDISAPSLWLARRTRRRTSPERTIDFDA